MVNSWAEVILTGRKGDLVVLGRNQARREQGYFHQVMRIPDKDSYRRLASAKGSGRMLASTCWCWKCRDIEGYAFKVLRYVSTINSLIHSEILRK